MIRRILLALLLLTGCHARLDWQLPPESAYHEAAVAMSVLCHVEAPPLLESAEVAGAALLPTLSGEHVVAYSPARLEQIQRAYGRPALLWLFGHELGHLCDASQGLESTELSADLQGGCVLAVLGESTYPARELLRAEAQVDAEHPPVSERIAAIAQGWDACSQLWRKR